MGDLVVVAGRAGAEDAAELVQKLSPDQISEVSNYMKRASGDSFADLRSGAVKWSKRAYLLFLEGVTSVVGFDAAHKVLSSSTTLPKAQMSKFAAGLQAEYSKVTAGVRSVTSGALRDTNVDTDSARDLVRRRMVERMIRAFGNVENAQAVSEAIVTLRPSDYQWYRTVIGRY